MRDLYFFDTPRDLQPVQALRSYGARGTAGLGCLRDLNIDRSRVVQIPYGNVQATGSNSVWARKVAACGSYTLPIFRHQSQHQHAHVVAIDPFNCTDRLQTCSKTGKIAMSRATTYVLILTKLGRQQESSYNRTSQRLRIQDVPPYASIIHEGTHIGFQATTVYP